MSGFRPGRAGAAVLLLLAALLAARPGAGLAAGPADLKIEYGGMQSTTLTLPTLTFKITNVGGTKSSATSAAVTTLAPPPANTLSVGVRALDPGKSVAFTYQLAAPCNGHQVQAAVGQSNDPNLADNQIQVTACDPLPAPTGGVTADDPRLNPHLPGVVDCAAHPLACAASSNPTGVAVNGPGLAPCPGCPGVHTLDLLPSVLLGTFPTRVDSDCGFLGTGFAGGELYSDPSLGVGWLQSGCHVSIGQVAVQLDTSILDQIPTKLVSEAKLTFAEQANAWRDTDGSPRNVDGCVSAIGIATEDWAATMPGDRLIANDTYQDYTPQNVHEFIVTVPFSQQLGNQAPRWGFVLRGSIEPLDHLEDHGQSSCMSDLSNIQLHVTYVVPDAS